MTTYLPCKRGGPHEGQSLNIVCLKQSCYGGPLCCSICIEQFHQGHQTKTLKKLLAQSQQILNKGTSQLTQKIYAQFNSNFLYNTVLQNQFKAMNKFKLLRYSINTTLDHIQQNLGTYFKQLKSGIQKANQTQNIQQSVQHSIQIINTGSDYHQVVFAVQRLILQLNKVDSEGNIKLVNNSAASVTNLVSQSNRQIMDLIDLRFTQIRNILTQSSNYLFDSTVNVNTIFQKQIFHFDQELCNSNIKVLRDNLITSQEESNYQMALMSPQLSNNQTQVFRFRISKLTNNWIAVGMAHRNILKSKNYRFDFKKLGHGAYMISANGGTWSSTMADLNNKVKAFKFQEGDVITCIVDNVQKSIYFVKQLQLSELTTTKRQVYQIPFIPIPGDPLHPCVTLFYSQNEVQYLPATNNSLIPKYQYMFTQVAKHSDIRIINQKLAQATQGTGYRSIILNRSLQIGNYLSPKQFSFRIVRSSSDWVAVGMCHLKIASQNQYTFKDYENIGHGYYMISSNGGSWSNTQTEKNNILRSFHFEQGDTISCYVQFGDGKEGSTSRIIFRRGSDKHILNFKTIQGDKLYPCVMFYYDGDQVNILPNF